MKKAHENVAAFNRMVGATVGDVARPDATADMELRVRLIAEEFDELLSALAPDLGHAHGQRAALESWLECLKQRRGIQRGFGESWSPPDLPSVADALADLEYVTVGAAVAWGIPGAAVWDEVHAANMRKAGGPKDPLTGKALKPPGWKGPDIDGVLRREAEKAGR